MLAHSLRSKTTAVRNLRFFGGTVPRMIMILDGISMGSWVSLLLEDCFGTSLVVGLFGPAIWMKQLMH